MIVAAFVVSQEVIEYHYAKLSAQVEQEEQTDESDSETEVSMLAWQVMLPGSTLSLEPFTPVFIREIELQDEDFKPVAHEISQDANSHLKTLFRRIISPNAP